VQVEEFPVYCNHVWRDQNKEQVLQGWLRAGKYCIVCHTFWPEIQHDEPKDIKIGFCRIPIKKIC